ncbi:hypothetical protein QE152_g10844 [Popillia japonica]|uniref:BESS domain-containing protein n=1 Tax=Popillia japonica TaxID=7064 RepID=A0AAW1LTE2_POPJA
MQTNIRNKLHKSLDTSMDEHADEYTQQITDGENDAEEQDIDSIAYQASPLQQNDNDDPREQETAIKMKGSDSPIKQTFLRDESKKREEKSKERHQLLQSMLNPPQLQDGLKLFFDSMYVSTSKLSPTQQRLVKRKLFEAVSELEAVEEASIGTSDKYRDVYSSTSSYSSNPYASRSGPSNALTNTLVFTDENVYRDM